MASTRLSVSLETLLAQRPVEVAELIEAVRSGADREQLSLVGTRLVRELEKGLGVLALIASIAPLLGLTGTVTGMIQAFMSIASHSGSRVEPSMVAGGIYEALITTAAGLFVAVPTHVALHFLEGRLDGIALRMKSLALALFLNAGARATAGSISPPLVDIVFNLLLFFVITYNIAVDSAIRVRLPDSSTAECLADEPIVISVTRGGETFTGGQPDAIEDLPAAVQAASGVLPGINVKIKADQEAAVGVLIKVVDGVRISGCTTFSMVTQRP
jgi:biopolymer transport protein ExbB